MLSSVPSGEKFVKKKKSKPSKRINLDGESEYWHGQGEHGQELLFSTLDPALVLCDSVISSQLNKRVREVRSTEDRQRCFVALNDDGGAWLIEYLTEHFDTVVYASHDEGLLELACEQFGAILIESISNAPPFEFDIVLILTTSKTDIGEFTLLASHFHSLRAPGCLFIEVFPVQSIHEQLEVYFMSGETFEIDSLLEGRVFGVDAPSNHELLYASKSQLSQKNHVEYFLKRHQRYFGKGRDLHYKRFAENPETSNRLKELADMILVCTWTSEGFEKY